MKLEVGMYVRTKDGTIDRIVEDENGVCSCPTSNAICCEKHILATFIITKASHNIIDLIEVGDYVNGFIVVEIPYMDNGKIVYKLHCGNNLLICNENHNIKSIVTKEQFSSMSYKVGE